MATLREKQSQFVFKIGQLIFWAGANGYELTFGEAYRSDEQAEINAIGADGRRALANLLSTNDFFAPLAEKIRDNVGSGIRTSLHMTRLAIDFNVFKDGNLLVKKEQIEPLGVFWESIGGIWGGRFGDAPHFSLAHEGKK